MISDLNENIIPTRRACWLVACLAVSGCASVNSQIARDSAPFARHELPANPHVPNSPDLIVERYVVVDAPAATLYGILLDLSTYDAWEPDVTVSDAPRARPLRAGDRFGWNRDGHALTITVLDVEENRYFRARGDTDNGIIGVRCFHFVELAPNRTAVIAYEEFSKWYFRLLTWATDFGISEQMDGTLARLKDYAERAHERRVGLARD